MAVGFLFDEAAGFVTMSAEVSGDRHGPVAVAYEPDAALAVDAFGF